MYVWAVEQDSLSKRTLPSDAGTIEQDLLVPWVLAPGAGLGREEEQVFQRYYHFFERDELRDLVLEAAQEMGLYFGSADGAARGVEIVQDGWERSNSYIELRLWSRTAP